MPRWTHFHFGCLLAASVLGWATTAVAQNPAPSVDAALPESAPVAVIDRLARQCRDAFAARPLTEVAYASSRGAWVKRSYAPAEVEAQVQKTASAVTPYVAQLTVTELASAQPGGEDFDTARAMDVPMDRNLLRSVRRMHFAFQGGQWTLMGAAVLMQVKADASMDFETARSTTLEPAAVRQLDGPISACTLQRH
jgi:hypothetical protein